MPLRWVFRVAAAAVLLVPSAASRAQPITYTFTGVGFGTYGSTAFAAALFTVTIRGDLSNPYEEAPEVVANGLVGTIGVGGVLTSGTFASPLYVFNNQTLQAVGFGGTELGGAGPDLLGLFVSGVGLATYDLRSTFGPITTADVRAVNQFRSVAVNDVPLTFTSVTTATFRAATDVTVIPEPTTVALVGTGLAVTLAIGRRRLGARV